MTVLSHLARPRGVWDLCAQVQFSCLQGRSLTWKCPGSLGVAILEGSCAGVFTNIWTKVSICHLLSLLFQVYFVSISPDICSSFSGSVLALPSSLAPSSASKEWSFTHVTLQKHCCRVRCLNRWQGFCLRLAWVKILHHNTDWNKIVWLVGPMHETALFQYQI